jgi:hypothetical protein
MYMYMISLTFENQNCSFAENKCNLLRIEVVFFVLRINARCPALSRFTLVQSCVM